MKPTREQLRDMVANLGMVTGEKLDHAAQALSRDSRRLLRAIHATLAQAPRCKVCGAHSTHHNGGFFCGKCRPPVAVEQPWAPLVAVLGEVETRDGSEAP